MPLRVRCPVCQAESLVLDHLLGKPIYCTGCRRILATTTLTTQPAPAPRPPDQRQPLSPPPILTPVQKPEPAARESRPRRTPPIPARRQTRSGLSASGIGLLLGCLALVVLFVMGGVGLGGFLLYRHLAASAKPPSSVAAVETPVPQEVVAAVPPAAPVQVVEIPPALPAPRPEQKPPESERKPPQSEQRPPTAERKPPEPERQVPDAERKLPPGWKEYTAADRSFRVWIPANAQRQHTHQRTSTLRRITMRENVLLLELGDGQVYYVEEVLVPPELLEGLPRQEMEALFKDLLLQELEARLEEETEVKIGDLAGREYRITTDRGVGRTRVFMSRKDRVVILIAAGTRRQVDSQGTKTFLDSLRLSAEREAVTGPPADHPGATEILGGAFDPEFTDRAPDGGLLVGFEIGLGTFATNEVFKSCRPIYRAGNREVKGKQYGTGPDRTVKALAREGYAVGAIHVKAGLLVDGMSVTFMKIAGPRKLDPKDSYESAWIGGQGGNGPTQLGGDGTPVIGVVGKTTQNELTGIGLLLKP